MIDRLLLIDPCFHSFDGHQFNYFKNIVDVARQRSIEPHIVSNKSIRTSMSEMFPITPAFDDLGIEMISDFSVDQTTNFNYNFFHFNNRFLINLVNATPNLPPITSNTVVFFATPSFRHVSAIISWLDLFPEAGRPRPVLLLRDRDLMPDRNRPLYRMTLPILASPRFGARFCSEAPIVAGHFAELANVAVATIPVPIEAQRFRERGVPSPRTELTVAFLGQARLSKGFHLLADISERVLAKSPNAAITVQAQVGEFDPDHDAAVAATLGRLRAMVGPRLQLLDGAASYDAYLDMLFASDIILLPYDPRTYRDSASAVLVEALAAGKVIVLPGGTSISNTAIQAGAGCVTFEGYGPGPVAAAVVEAVSRHGELSRSAESARAPWIAEHDVGRVVDYLCREPTRAA